MTIRNHLIERKGLKQVKRKWLKEGMKVTHQIKSITWVNQQIHFKWVSRIVLGERSLLPSVGACHLCVGKPSMLFGRQTWKWWSEGHLRCLVEAIKRVDQEKHLNLVTSNILTLRLSYNQRWNEEASQPQQKSTLDH